MKAAVCSIDKAKAKQISMSNTIAGRRIRVLVMDE
jgi:hypothetical protein